MLKRRADFPDEDLVYLSRVLARLTSMRTPGSRKNALGSAHYFLRLYAAENSIPEVWCDLVLLEFLDR
jgi:hypothetical protein